MMTDKTMNNANLFYPAPSSSNRESLGVNITIEKVMKLDLGQFLHSSELHRYRRLSTICII